MTTQVPLEEIRSDVLIVGSGGAGLFAALHLSDAAPALQVLLVVKGLFGKSGCTRMVQGGYNAVLHPADSLELHFRDTIVGGHFLNRQELAWRLVQDAPERIRELETRVGCFFDRNPDGTIHQKPFAGQSFDRTVHRGDLTGIEIVSRLAEQVMARPHIRILEECRALDLLFDRAGQSVGGALLLDIRRGRFLVARARAVLVATGGGARMYRFSSPSVEKSGDGVAMAYRAGAHLMDMEMLQFHPTGLLAGKGILTGSVVEEGLRGAGGRLYNAQGERFMGRYDPDRQERASRDVVSRAIYTEVVEGRGTENGGVYLDMSHLGPRFVAANFPGMADRARLAGRDLTREPIEVCPTAHFYMGGVAIDEDGATNVDGLFVAGEDAGGVHGANRLGGNGVAESTTFGARAGDALARHAGARELRELSAGYLQERLRHASAYVQRPVGESPFDLRRDLESLMWEKAGVVRRERDLREGLSGIEGLRDRLTRVGVAGVRGYDLAFHEALNMHNLLVVAEALVRSALLRAESRGAHFRSDFPAENDREWLKNIHVRGGPDGAMVLWSEPVTLTRLRPEDVRAHVA
ncbi:MAG: FAD-dependent oxidoreductase [Gemmatimonadetes bacterium]|nr:FAD-dependent oxidoreductase [Gemmatimonadota bacterium]